MIKYGEIVKQTQKDNFLAIDRNGDIISSGETIEKAKDKAQRLGEPRPVIISIAEYQKKQ